MSYLPIVKALLPVMRQLGTLIGALTMFMQFLISPRPRVSFS